MRDAARPRLDGPDLDLLRAFEPVVRYTRGESFLPMSVDTYLAAAAHMRSEPGRRDRLLSAPGSLSDETLADYPRPGIRARDYVTVAGIGEQHDVATLFRSEARQAVGFRSEGSRLARVGYTARLVDAVFSLSLLARGRVPGSLARRSVERYRAMAGEDRTHPYYGRVVRSGTWAALQYWFFYAFNDWRSGFHGANDHEADWEQILVYLDTDGDGGAIPVWAAYAQHDYHGRDLRRRWDDAVELELIGDHPVVYAGAGSHASYFRPGDYLAEQGLRLPGVVRQVVNGFTRLMNGTRRDGDERIFSIAFVDYARGDGVNVGPGCEHTWQGVVLDERQPWVPMYSGLWGLSVQDPFQGEDAPAGPMYNRDGSVRLSWSDPVAFAELDLEPPPSEEPALLRQRVAAAGARTEVLATIIPERQQELAGIGAELGKLADGDHDKSSAQAGVNRLQAELTLLLQERQELALRLDELRRRIQAVDAGWRPHPQAHLRRIPVPTPAGADRAGVLLEAWAAVSIGLLLLALVAALVLAPRFGLVVAAGVIAVFVFVESILRNEVVGFIVAWVRLLALLATAVLLVEFWELAIIVAAVAAGLFVIRENVAELIASARSNR